MASMGDVKDFYKSQLYTKIPVPDKLFTGQTIIVTGSNVGYVFPYPWFCIFGNKTLEIPPPPFFFLFGDIDCL